MNLSLLGWSAPRAAQVPVLQAGQFLGRVAIAHADRAILLPTGMVYQPKHADGRVAVGDWVIAEGQRIVQVLPRHTHLSRRAAGAVGDTQVIATNVDTVFLTTAMSRDFNPGRLLRSLTVVHAGGAQPVIVLTKSDLAIGQEGRFLRELPPEVPFVCTSALLGLGLDELRAHLAPGRTVVFIGTSGAGKSTLFNALLGAEIMSTGPVRAEDERGKHTTTHRELRVFDQGVLIDTPGMRELGILGEDGLDRTFADIVEAAAACRYADCAHQGDEGCAVVDQIDPDRLAQWQKLQREAAYEARRSDVRLQLEAQRQWRARTKAQRARTADRKAR